MNGKEFRKLIGKRVVRKGRPAPVGAINGPAKIGGWWVVWWDDGKRTQEPLRNLEVVPDDRR